MRPQPLGICTRRPVVKQCALKPHRPLAAAKIRISPINARSVSITAKRSYASASAGSSESQTSVVRIEAGELILRVHCSVKTRQDGLSTSLPLAEAAPPPRLRFAPSPTGYLHLGGLRTALFNHLLARKWKGKWILRIEDTDRSRFVPDAVSSLQSALSWTGLDYDEGPSTSASASGSKGPYVQSQRLDLYHTYANRLLEEDKAYRCFCTPNKLGEIKEEQKRRKALTSYDGRCRHLTEEEVGRRRRDGESFVVRFKAQDHIVPNPPDLIFGEYSGQPAPSSPEHFRPRPPHLASRSPSSSFLSSSSGSSSHAISHSDASTSSTSVSHMTHGNVHGKHKGPGLFASNHKEDFILLKSDGWPTYHLASVVDDHEMGITHVLRGEEWLPSTTKHVQLYSAFDLTPPQFAHLPLLTNPDGTKLSKRTGDVRVEDYRARGYEPTALINFLGLMGWDHHRQALATHPFFPPIASDVDPNLVSDEMRRDLHSVTELFTLPALTEAFDLKYVNHRRSAVFLPKLDWLNKMHLRRAGTRGETEAERNEEGLHGVMEDGTGPRRDRKWLIRNMQALLREKKVLAGCDLIEDEGYVGKVLDVELPRATVLKDIADLSVLFFLDPDLGSKEAESMLSSIPNTVYARVVSQFISRLADLAAPDGYNRDAVWDAMHRVIDDCSLSKKQHAIAPIRHALTGRRTGPPVPDVAMTLGKERCMARLEAAEAWMESRSRSDRPSD